jgi:protein TonB
MGILSETGQIAMNVPETPTPAPTKTATGPGIVSSGWLAAESTFGQADKRRLGAGLGVSLALHAGLFGLLILAFAVAPDDSLNNAKQFVQLVFLQQPGPGGGGGGSPTPAPPKPQEIPKAKPEPVPVTPPPPVPPPPVPPPTLNAPIITPNAQTIQATGLATISLANYGGGGRGRGLGEGRGSGVGEGEGGGTGGGVFRLGSGIENPKLLKDQRPNYTPEAMRLKIQGTVVLEAVILSDGTVGEVKVVKSLDSINGLDAEAIKAAKKWLFKPALRQGKPVDVYATIEVAFRIL